MGDRGLMLGIFLLDRTKDIVLGKVRIARVRPNFFYKEIKKFYRGKLERGGGIRIAEESLGLDRPPLSLPSTVTGRDEILVTPVLPLTILP